MSEHRVPYSVRDEARDGASDWSADRFDEWFFNQLCGNTDQTDTRFTGNQTVSAFDADHVILGPQTHAATASMTSTNVMSLEMIDYGVELAKTLTPAIRPIRINNDSYFVAFLHPYQITDLRTNTNTGQWLDIQKEAAARGRDNPIFTGAHSVHNGCIIVENTRVPTGPATDGGGTTRRAVFCGAQAAAIAFGQGDGPNRISWNEELFDYGSQLGVGFGWIGGLKRLEYDSKTYGAIQLLTAAAKHS